MKRKRKLAESKKRRQGRAWQRVRHKGEGGRENPGKVKGNRSGTWVQRPRVSNVVGMHKTCTERSGNRHTYSDTYRGGRGERGKPTPNNRKSSMQGVGEKTTRK